MLKLAGAGMVLVAFAVLGYSKSLSLKLRCESIARVLYSLRIMENEISYGKISMEKVMESIKKLGGISAENPSGDGAGEWFLNAVEYEKLEKADMEVLTSFSKTLGITDTASQQRNIKNTVKTTDAEGRICAGVHCPCPPCVPLVMPGEKIDGKCISELMRYGVTHIDICADI